MGQSALSDGSDKSKVYYPTTSTTTTTTTTTATTTTTTSPPQAISSLKDNFNDNSFDTNKWLKYGTSNGTVTETGQQLVFHRTATAYFGIYSGESPDIKHFFNLEDDEIFVKIPQVAGGVAVSCVCGIRLFNPEETSYIAIYYDNTSPGTDEIFAGATDGYAGNFVAYNSTNHRWWRIREASGTLYLDFSANGIDWNNFVNDDTPFDVSAVFVEFFVIADETTQDFLVDEVNEQATTTTTTTT
jgi:hypothetical protein